MRSPAANSSPAVKPPAGTQHPPTLRWGFVGTGSIANWMADVVRTAPMAELAAVASRRIDTASAFASRHGAARAFGSWAEMLAWEGIDAVYVATPTALREEICIAAADAGKHVLGEKPFASLASLRRITAACRGNGVAFMDATHFVHHPRTAEVLANKSERIGAPQLLDSTFLVDLANRSDIRYDPTLEPMGALGDLGWYNMRAAVEYLAPDGELRSASARPRRDRQTGAIIAGAGLLTFEDGTVSSWRCGFDADAAVIELKLSGRLGEIRMDNFIGENEDGSAGYSCASADAADADATRVRVASRFSAPSLMFQDFAASAGNASLRERWIRASERTQALLDAAWEAAAATERTPPSTSRPRVAQ